jgi:hypothetical protein
MGLTAGPHLPVTGAKRKREAAVLGQRWKRAGPLRAARSAEKGRWPEKICELKEKREGEGNWASWKRRERGERKVFSFSFKFFSNSFFKLSNFNQTEIHAFES